MGFKIVDLGLAFVCLSTICFGQGFSTLNDRYAVVIGISNYKDKSLSLKYGAKDALDIQSSIRKTGRFTDSNIRVLTDSLATWKNIRKAIVGWLQPRVQKDDLVLIFFSGHGTQSQDYNQDEEDGMDEYLVPFDYEQGDISSGICDDEFSSWIRNLMSTNVLVMLDCCFSGGAAKQKGFSPAGYKGGVTKDDFLKDVAREVPRSGVALMAACKSDQVSFESDDLKNGVFTHFVIQAASSNADIDLNNIISEQELFTSSRSKILSFTKDKFNREQEPVLISQLQRNMDLFYVPISNSTVGSSDSVAILKYRLKQFAGRPSLQFPILESLFRLNPNDIQTLGNLAHASLSLSRLDKALYYFDLLNSKTGRNWFAEKIGEVYFRKEMFQKAIEWFEKSSKTEDVLNRTADAYLELHDTTKALEVLSGSIRANKFQKSGYLRMFYVHFRCGDYVQGYSVLEKCREVNPVDQETLFWLGNFEKHINNNVLLGDSLLGLFNNSDVQRMLGGLERYKGAELHSSTGTVFRGNEYRKYLIEEALERYPYFPELHKRMVMCAVDMENKDLVKKYYDSYLFYGKLDMDKAFISEHEEKVSQPVSK